MMSIKTKRKWRIFLITSILFLILTACYKDSLELKKLSNYTELDLGLGGPIAYGDIRLSDAVKRANSKYLTYIKDLDKDSIIQFVFDTSFVKRSRDSFFKGLPFLTDFGEPIVKTLGPMKIDAFGFIPQAGATNTLKLTLVEYLDVKTGVLSISWGIPSTFKLDLFTSQSISGSQTLLASVPVNNLSSIDVPLNGKTLQSYLIYKTSIPVSGIGFVAKNIIASRGKVEDPTKSLVHSIDSVMTIPINYPSTKILPLDGKKIDTLYIKRGVINVNSDLTIKNAKVSLNLIPDEKVLYRESQSSEKLVKFNKSMNIPYGQSKDSLDLSEVLLCPKNSANPNDWNNPIPLSFKYTIDIASQNGFVEFDEKWGLTLTLSNDKKMDFHKILGHLGTQPYSYKPDKLLATNMGKNLGDLASAVGGIQFTNPRIELDYVTSAGVRADIYMNISGIAASGKKVDVLQDNQVLKFNSPLKPKLFDPIIPKNDTITIDTSKSKYLGTFFNIIPEYVDYNVTAYPNPGDYTGKNLNFVDENSNLDVKFRLLVPMQFTMKDVALSNDFAMNLKQNNIEEVESIRLVMKFKNQFPLDVQMKVTLLDSLNHKIDSLKSFIIQAATSDATTGKVDHVVKKDYLLDTTLTNTSGSLVQNLLKARRIKLTAILNTYRNPTKGQRPVTIYTYYTIGFQMGAEVRGKYKGNIK